MKLYLMNTFMNYLLIQIINITACIHQVGSLTKSNSFKMIKIIYIMTDQIGVLQQYSTTLIIFVMLM